MRQFGTISFFQNIDVCRGVTFFFLFFLVTVGFNGRFLLVITNDLLDLC